MRRLLPLPILLFLVAAHPASASAHANLVRAFPAPGAVIPHAPTEARFVFDDVVQPAPGVAAIRNGAGSVLAGSARVVGGKTLVVPLRRGLPDGDYSIRWVILSDDGHLESGVVAFAVGAGRPPPIAALTAATTGPGPASVIERWLLLLGILGAGGISLFAFAVLRTFDDAAAGRMAVILGAAATLTVLGAGGELERVGFNTRDGTALAPGVAAALLVALLALAAIVDRRALRPALLLALGLLAVPSVAGHALDPGLARVNLAADILHVAAASAWVGVLVGLIAFRVERVELRRCVRLALVAVVVLAATGVLRASYELLSPSQLWSTGYGRTLFVKTAILLAALAAGLVTRRRPRQRAATELVIICGLLIAVAVLVQLRPGRNTTPSLAPTVTAAASGPSANPPPPPLGAVLLADEVGPLGVALAVQEKRLTVTVLAPGGGGVNHLRVILLPSGTAARSCGSGCYTAQRPPTSRIRLAIHVFGETRRVTFIVPAHSSPANALLRRARALFHTLHGVTYVERLATDPRHALTSRWRLEAPDRLSYTITGGAAAIVIGKQRWDRNTPTARWIPSPQLPQLPQPTTAWTQARDAHIIARSASSLTLSFADPTIPAFYTLTLDRGTLRPQALHMISNAHFMTDHYLGFSPSRQIRPPRK